MFYSVVKPAFTFCRRLQSGLITIVHGSRDLFATTSAFPRGEHSRRLKYRRGYGTQ